MRDSINSKDLTWLNIINAKELEIDYLRKKFKFDALDLEDSLVKKHAQRPKLNESANYLFLIFLFPVYNRKKREITPAEIDIFLTTDHLITIHDKKLDMLGNIFIKAQKDNIYKNQLFEDTTPAFLLYEILSNLLNCVYPMLDHISEDIQKIEKNIFNGNEREMVEEILIIKRNIVNFRKIMQAHKDLIKKILSKLHRFDNEDLNRYYKDLLDNTKNIWDIVENLNQTLTALGDTNNTLISFKLNNIMRTLTIFSVIVFPLTLFAALFGMNTQKTPIVGHEFDFWILLGIMIVLTIIMYVYFKYKKWI